MGLLRKPQTDTQQLHHQRSKLLTKHLGRRRQVTRRELINRESEIGRELFGPIPKGMRREFFNLDPTTWIWHEESINPKTKKKETRTVKYEVHKDHILKVEEGPRYTKMHGQELSNFTLATHMYYERTMREIYNRDPATGKKLA